MASLTSTDPLRSTWEPGCQSMWQTSVLVDWEWWQWRQGRFLQPDMLRDVTEPWTISDFQFQITLCLWWTCFSIQAVFAAQILSTGFVSSLGSETSVPSVWALVFQICSWLGEVRTKVSPIPGYPTGSQNTSEGNKKLNLSKKDFQKVPALCYTSVTRQDPRGSGWTYPSHYFPLELKEMLQDFLLPSL